MNVSASLFPDAPAHMPLTERLRPHSADDVTGQQHLLGPGKSLCVVSASGELHSMILQGPPGVGKTTPARLMANAFDAEFIALSAALSDIKDIREAVERVEQFRAHDRRTLVPVDEIHRFNKGQQDAFLPHVENGLFTFIGVTAENPSFEVSSTLFLRAAMYVLKSLSDDELKQLAERARQELGGLEWTPAVLDAVIASTDGDGRKLLNNTEIVARAARAQADDDAVPAVDKALLASTLSENLRRFDKGGDASYDQINALHKSVRGSDPDGALHWFCRMLDGGADPYYLARHTVCMAWEDIGLADPRAGRITLDATEACERLGSPEGELASAQMVIHLAIALKSNAGYNAYNTARAFVSQDKLRNVPVYLRDAPTKLMKELGYGHAYRYAHDELKAYTTGETYFPDDLSAQNQYVPTPRGLEGKIGEKLQYPRELDVQWHTEQGKSSRNK